MEKVTINDIEYERDEFGNVFKDGKMITDKSVLGAANKNMSMDNFTDKMNELKGIDTPEAQDLYGKTRDEKRLLGTAAADEFKPATPTEKDLDIQKTEADRLNEDKNKNEEYKGTAEETSTEIDEAAENAEQNFDDLINQNEETTKKLTEKRTTAAKEGQKYKKYAQNVGKSLYARYKRGDFNDPDLADNPEEQAKQAKKTFANLLVNEIGTTLYNIGSIWKGTSDRATSDFSKIKESDLAGALERKEKADSAEYDNWAKMNDLGNEEAAAMKKKFDELSQNDVWGPYMSKLSFDEKRRIATIDAKYGKYLKDNPELYNDFAYAATSGDKDFIVNAVTRAAQRVEGNNQKKVDFMIDMLLDTYQVPYDAAKKDWQKMYEILSDINVMNKIGPNNMKQITQFMKSTGKGTFWGNVADNLENSLVNKLNF